MLRRSRLWYCAAAGSGVPKATPSPSSTGAGGVPPQQHQQGGFESQLPPEAAAQQQGPGFGSSTQQMQQQDGERSMPGLDHTVKGGRWEEIRPSALKLMNRKNLVDLFSDSDRKQMSFVMNAITGRYTWKQRLLSLAAALAIPILYMLAQFKWARCLPCPSPPVPEGVTRICVAGYHMSPPTGKAHYLADAIAKAHPEKYETWYYFDLYTFSKYVVWRHANVDFPERLKGHETSPFVWLERGKRCDAEPLGGCDDFSDWVIAHPELKKDDDIQILAAKQPSPIRHTFHTGKKHPKATCYGCLSDRCQ